MSTVGPGKIATRQTAPQPLILRNDRQPTSEGRSGGMRETIESAQGLVPARRVRHRHRQAGGHMQEIVCKVLFLKLEGQEKKVSTGGSITDEKIYKKPMVF